MTAVGGADDDRPYLRLVSWNMGGAFAGGKTEWAHLLADQGWDAGLLQEAPNPWAIDVQTAPPADGYWKTDTSGQFRARTAIARLSDRVALQEIRTAPLASAGPGEFAVSRVGTVTAAELSVASTEEQITLISVYGLWENPVPYQRLIYADASMHRILSDISALTSGQDRPVVLAGDFNLVRELNSPMDAETWNRRQSNVFDRLDALGFTFVGPQTPNGVPPSTPTPGMPTNSRAVVTHRHKRGDPETGHYQLDYVYVTHQLVDRTRTRALNDGEEWGPSDHCQIAIDIAAPTEPIWNQTTFATAIERQAGPTSRAVVERIFAWGSTHPLGLRVAFAKGQWGQVWFQYDGGVEGLQYTFSVLAEGDLLVQFQYLRTPFKDPDDREPIRQMLNQIPGIDIITTRGRPRVHLSALADPEALERFLAVFDHVLEQTRALEPPTP